MFSKSISKSNGFLIALAMALPTFAHADYYQNQDRSNTYYNYSDQERMNPNANQERMNSNYNQDRMNNSNNPGMSDQELAKQIHDKLNSGWFTKGFEQVNFQVHNGNVVLNGIVKNSDDKDKLEKEIRNIDGVRSLNSQIRVQELTSKDNEQKKMSQDRAASSADDQLNKKIRDNISGGWLWDSYKEISLNTNNGVVTLEGTVDSPSDQQKLLNEIQKVDGVRMVRSNLRINNR